MDIKNALEEIILFDTLKRWDTWYLEIETGQVDFITEEQRINNYEFPKDKYIKCPYCAPYVAKEYIASRNFDRSLLDQYEIITPLVIHKYYSRDYIDESIRSFVRNFGLLRHDLRLNKDYYEFSHPLTIKLAEEWLNEIQSQITASHP